MGLLLPSKQEPGFRQYGRACSMIRWYESVRLYASSSSKAGSDRLEWFRWIPQQIGCGSGGGDTSPDRHRLCELLGDYIAGMSDDQLRLMERHDRNWIGDRKFVERFDQLQQLHRKADDTGIINALEYLLQLRE